MTDETTTKTLFLNTIYSKLNHTHTWTKIAEVSVGGESGNPLGYRIWKNETLRLIELFVDYTTQEAQQNSRTPLAINVSEYAPKGIVVEATQYPGVTVEVRVDTQDPSHNDIKICGTIEEGKRIISSLMWHY